MMMMMMVVVVVVVVVDVEDYQQPINPRNHSNHSKSCFFRHHRAARWEQCVQNLDTLIVFRLYENLIESNDGLCLCLEELLFSMLTPT